MPLSADHKRKISEGLRKYHSTCKAKKPKSDIQKEIIRLQKRADRKISDKQKENLRREVIKLKKML